MFSLPSVDFPADIISCRVSLELESFVFATLRFFTRNQGRDEVQRKADGAGRTVPVLGFLDLDAEQSQVGIFFTLGKPHDKLWLQEFRDRVSVAHQPRPAGNRDVVLILRIGKTYVDSRCILNLAYFMRRRPGEKPEAPILIDSAVGRHGTAMQIAAFIDGGQHTKVNLFDQIAQL